MKLFLLTSILLSIAAGGIAGVRLLAIARRTHRLPEFAIALGLLSFVIGQSAIVSLRVIGIGADPDLVGPLATTAIAGFGATLIAFSVFLWRVFGVDSSWRRSLAVVLSLVGAFCGWRAISSIATDLAGGPAAPPHWRLGLNVCFVTVFSWLSLESLSYYGKMRRRVVLGLAEPVVANRFLVWGGGAALSILCAVLSALLLTTGGSGAQGPLFGLPAAVGGLTNAVTWWLSFMPPRRYRRWITDRAGVRSPSEFGSPS